MSNKRTYSRDLPNCPDCGVRPGKRHTLGCDVEQCPRCYGQMLQCLMMGCQESIPGTQWPPSKKEREPWTGEWPESGQCFHHCDQPASHRLHRAKNALRGALRPFFDGEAHRACPANKSHCWGCQRPWKRCNVSNQSQASFTRITGQRWPGGSSIWVPLRKDFNCLGLDASHVPEMLCLCLECVVEYMNGFNQLLAEQQNPVTE